MAELDPLAELNHYYQGCILKYPVDDFNFPFYVDNFEYDKQKNFRAAGSLGSLRHEKLMWSPTILDASELDFSYPELGCININKSVVYVKRIPERQYKKAFNERTITINNLVPIIDDIESSYGVMLVNRDILNVSYNIFNQIYSPIDTIISSIENGELYAGAFSKNFYVYPQLITNTLLVGYKYNKVGYIKDKKIFLPLKNDYLIQELSQHMETEVMRNV